MNNDPAFFKELHSFDGDEHTLVINEITGDVGVLKRLSYFNEEVYDELASLDSKHIPKILCHGRFENYCNGDYIVIEEHISGVTLEEYLEKNKPSKKERMKFFREISDALIELHGLPKPVIHRDIKASNIMITGQGCAVLVDFDAAKIANPDESQDTTLIGTQGYAAPEQYGFGASDERTDIYAFGKLIEKMFPDSRRMRAIAKRATAMDPKFRFQSVKAMKYSVVDLKHSIFPMPGFRTGNIGKAVFACVVYAYVLYQIVTFGDPDSPSYVNIVNRFILAIIFLCELDLFTDWVHIMSRLPFVLHPKRVVRVFAKILWGIVLAISLVFVLAFLVALVATLILS